MSYHTDRYAQLKAQNRCAGCKLPTNGKARCESCLAKMRGKHKQYLKDRRAVARANKLCEDCLKPASRRLCDDCRLRRNRYAVYYRKKQNGLINGNN